MTTKPAVNPVTAYLARIGRTGGQSRSQKKLDALKRTSQLPRPRARKIQHEYRDSDGYWIELMPGWICDGVHQIHEDTKRAAHGCMAMVERCDCAECLDLIAAAARKKKAPR